MNEKTDTLRLPIVIINSPGRRFRWLHIAISAPLVILATIAAFGDDVTSIFAFALAAVISYTCECLGRWADRTYARRYEIDTQGVSYRDARKAWYEPLSSYTSVDWHEEVISSRPGRYSFVNWQVDLSHSTDPARTVKLLGSSLFTGDKDLHRFAWRAAARALDLPARQTGGTGVDIAEIPPAGGTAPAETGKPEFSVQKRLMPWSNPYPAPALAAQPAPPDDIPQSEIRVGRSHLAWILPILFTLIGVGILYQEVAREGLGRVFADFGDVLFMSAAALTALWGWVLTGYRIQVSSRTVTVVSHLGPYGYRSRTMDRRSLREVLVHSNPFGVAWVSLQGENRRSIQVPTLSYAAARKVQRFITDAKGVVS